MRRVTRKQLRQVPGIKKLRGFLGGQGIKVRRIKSVDEYIHVAAAVFALPPVGSAVELGEMIAKLTVDERRERAGKNIPLLGPDVSAIGRRKGISSQPQNRRVIAVNDGKLKDFYDSPEWRRLSYDVKKERGRRCECCGSTPEHGVRIITDHIKPIRKHWHLRLERSNLQILCDDCNLGKGSRDETDFRRSEDEIPEGASPLLVAQLTPPYGVLQ